MQIYQPATVQKSFVQKLASIHKTDAILQA